MPGRLIQRLAPAVLLIASGCLPRATGPTPRTDDRAALRAVIDSMLAAPDTRHARWGVLIVDPDRGDTLYSRDAGKLFVPASNMKIVTSAVALTALGPDFRFATPVVAMGPVHEGTLHGDLVVAGRGDPSVSDHLSGDAMLPLQAMAEAVAARGIRRIAGAVRPGANAFPDAVFGFGWAWDDLDYAYSAPIDELLFNEGFSTIHLVAGLDVSDTVRAWTTPARGFPRVRLDLTTLARDSVRDSVRSEVEAIQDSLTGTFLVRGVVLAGDSLALAVTHRDPGAAYLAAFREALADQGISIDDSSLAAPADPVPDTIHVHRSPTLGHILGFFMKPSQNQIGEMLLKAVALQATDTGTARIGRRLVAAQLRAWGADSAGFFIADGSGLSRRNLVTPETLVRILDAMRRGPSFQAFYDAFPVAGVDGTLRGRMRGTAAEGNVRGKTGTLGGVRSLSGYVTTADGQQLLFSIMANNYLVGTDVISRVQDTIAVRLSGLRGMRPAASPLLPESSR